MGWLSHLADRAAAEDQAMIEAGYEIEHAGPLGGRTYRLSAETIARRRAEAEDEHIRHMGQRTREMFALAFPEQAADITAREAAQAQSATADVTPNAP